MHSSVGNIALRHTSYLLDERNRKIKGVGYGFKTETTLGRLASLGSHVTLRGMIEHIYEVIVIFSKP